MTENPEELLQRALDSVDRSRTKLQWALGSVVLVLLGRVAFIMYGDPLRSVTALVHDVFVMLILAILVSTVVVCLHVTRMARKILRGIETLGRRPAAQPLTNESNDHV